MIPRGVYTPGGIMACPLHMFRGHAMILQSFYTPLIIMVCPLDR